MGVYIKDLEMPKDSKYVDVRIFNNGTATTSTAEEPFYKKMDVIEVPPHGRLIDADALNELIDSGYDLDFDEVPETKRELKRMIDDAQTIIEEDGKDINVTTNEAEGE